MSLGQKRASALSIGILLILSAIAVYYYFGTYRPHAPILRTVNGTEEVVDVQKEGAYWKERIRAVGADQAHREFFDTEKILTKLKPPPQFGTTALHIEAHVFGDALYAVEGEAGFSVCGPEFGLGCLHSFLGRLVREYGVEKTMDKLYTQCAHEEKVTLKLGCEHGLGHGILGTIGYSLDDLKKAIATCGTREKPENLMLGCTGGALMEYNFHFLERAEGIVGSSTPLTETDTDLFSPCFDIGPEYRAACAFWQPQRWFGSLEDKDPVVRIEKMAQYCHKLSRWPDAEHSCFAGIGDTIPQRINNVKAIAEGCAYTDDIQNRAACWSFGRIRAESNNLKLDDALPAMVCKGITPSKMASCIAIVREARSVLGNGPAFESL